MATIFVATLALYGALAATFRLGQLVRQHMRRKRTPRYTDRLRK